MSAAPGLTDWMLSPHAEQQLALRGIALSVVEEVLRHPDQRLLLRPGREVFQRRVIADAGAVYSLVRVFVDVDRAPPEVVTAYRTSKIEKYLRRNR